MQPNYKTVEEAISDINEASAEEFLKEDARREGLPWHVYCYKYGIVGKSQRLRIKRHEAKSFLDWKGTEE